MLYEGLCLLTFSEFLCGEKRTASSTSDKKHIFNYLFSNHRGSKWVLSVLYLEFLNSSDKRKQFFLLNFLHIFFYVDELTSSSTDRIFEIHSVQFFAAKENIPRNALTATFPSYLGKSGMKKMDFYCFAFIFLF